MRVRTVSTEFYDDKARECEEKASTSGDRTARTKWLALAAQWRRLAAEVVERQRSMWGDWAGETRISARPPHQASGRRNDPDDLDLAGQN